MVANLSLNQFAPNQPIDGLYVYMANEGQLHNVIVGPDTTLKAGDFVMLDATSTNVHAPVVVELNLEGNGIPFGVVSYTPIKATHSTGERVGLARDYDVIWKTASEAIAVGTPITVDTDNKVRAVASGDNYFLGIALTPSAKDGDLIQVELKTTIIGA